MSEKPNAALAHAVREGGSVAEVFADYPLLAPQGTSFTELPALIPLLEERQLQVPYVVLEASAEGGRIRTYLTGREQGDVRVEGETEYVHEAKSGGLSHFRHAHHTEEVWKRNETELADVVNRLVERNDVRLVFVTGDPHVVDLVSTALSIRARALLVTRESDTLAAGASSAGLDALIAQRVERTIREHRLDAIGRAAAQQGTEHSTVDRSVQSVVHALQQADVEVLLLDLDGLESHTLLSLDGEPWVASVEEESYGAAVLGSGSAAEALARAAVATDADVIVVDHDSLPGRAPAAIVHR
jgi:hypothetical protein